MPVRRKHRLRIGVTFNVRQPAASPAGTASLGAADGLSLDISLDGATSPAIDDEQEEFDSPETISAMAGAIESLGHEVELLGYGEPMLRRSWLDTWGVTLLILGIVAATVLFVAYGPYLLRQD